MFRYGNRCAPSIAHRDRLADALPSNAHGGLKMLLASSLNISGYLIVYRSHTYTSTYVAVVKPRVYVRVRGSKRSRGTPIVGSLGRVHITKAKARNARMISRFHCETCLLCLVCISVSARLCNTTLHKVPPGRVRKRRSAGCYAFLKRGGRKEGRKEQKGKGREGKREILRRARVHLATLAERFCKRSGGGGILIVAESEKGAWCSSLLPVLLALLLLLAVAPCVLLPSIRQSADSQVT